MSDSTLGASQKSRRYYYTDPLAAAWMAKHFGMIIYTAGLDNGVHPKRIRDYIEDVITIAEDVARQSETDRYYIHHDSLHLLEPQAGDLVKIDTPDTFFYTHVTAFYGDKSVGIQSGWVTRRNLIERGDISRVIQRNGVAFMWPNFEEQHNDKN